MSRLTELNTNVNYVTGKLLEDQNLCKLLYYANSTPLSSTPIANTSILLFDNIFPQPKDAESIKDNKTILTYVFSNIVLNKKNTRYKDEKLIFNVMCHLDNWKISGGLRPYYIAAELDDIFNELRGSPLTIGKVLFQDMLYREYSNYYAGYTLIYSLCDFN